MNIGHFYFLSEEYFSDFPDPNLMKNKEEINGISFDRPCYYSFIDNKTGVYWFIPFSSKVEKYKSYYDKAIAKYDRCDTIVFGNVLGYKKAFLIQNICPVIPKYIKNEYIDKKTKVFVELDNLEISEEIIRKAKLVIASVRRGTKLVFPDILKIEKELLKMV